jgi:hypothetical protein
MAKRIVDGFMKNNPDAIEPSVIFLGEEITPFKVGENFIIPVDEDPLQYFTELPDSFDINFPGTPDMPFPHRSVLQTLTELTAMTVEIVKSFRARFEKRDITSGA